jgi:hypothetical protein
MIFTHGSTYVEQGKVTWTYLKFYKNLSKYIKFGGKL